MNRPIDRVWAAMKASPDGFTRQHLMKVTGASTSTVDRTIRLLVEEGAAEFAGYLPRQGRVGHPLRTWRLLPHALAETPRCVRPIARQQIWTAMRIRLTFTMADLKAQVDTHESNIKEMCSQLVKLGILKEAGRNQPTGQPGSWKVYRLVRDPGPVLPDLSHASRPRGEVRHG